MVKCGICGGEAPKQPCITEDGKCDLCGKEVISLSIQISIHGFYIAGNWPTRIRRGMGVIAKLTSKMYLGSGYNPLIPAIRLMPPPPPIRVLPGRFKLIAINK